MNYETDERLEKFDQHVDHLIAAVRLCLENKHIIPAMMLLFAGIDGMASLYKESDDAKNRAVFTRWVDAFLIPCRAPNGVTSEDYWANRNALLHEQGSNSNLTRRGDATPFWYEAAGYHAIPLHANWKREPVTLQAHTLVKDFERAIKNFRSFIETSPHRETILTRCNEFFDLQVVAAESRPRPEICR